MSNLTAETLTIHGPDAIAFAQAQLASDVEQLPVGAWQWSAWLNPQGRVRALLHVIRIGDDALRLLLRGGTAAAMAKALEPYVLRRHVALTAHAAMSLVDAPACPAGSVHARGDTIVLGLGGYAIALAPSAAQPAQRWRTHAIAAGHPWLPASALDALLAPALALRSLGAVKLGKGCFPGQEVVARLHFRGGCKQHLRRIESAALLPAGSTLRVDGAPVGTLLDSVSDARGGQALAVVRDALPVGAIGVMIDGRSYNIRVFNMLQ